MAGVVAGVRRTLDDRPPWRPEEALTLDQALHATCVAPAWLSHDERTAAPSCRGGSRTSSSSTATPSPASRRSSREVQVVATMVAGRWVHNPPPWAEETLLSAVAFGT